eukprot:6194694-Pleurochrysis_carterae.AAC.2
MNMNIHNDALLRNLMSLGREAGNVVIRVFDIIRKAGGNGVNAQRGIAGVYQGDDKSKPIIRGLGIRGEVHKIATKINKADTQDVATVKEVLRWLGLDSNERTKEHRVEEINRICTIEDGRRALEKFQQHKGLGSDGFDGYLIRNAPLEVQELYHQTIKDILISEDYPTAWNEWIAVLMMKPGEDPFELGRRRDIWLQCHSMKYVCRLMEAEYNKVADKQVPITQAGWTEDRMATEHSMTVRIIEERCELHRKPCIKGYVDLGCFFMSVYHNVQWEIEETMGVSETIISIMKALREGKGKGLHSLTGRYETAYGSTDPVEIQKGLGQGDLLSPVRSKLILAVIQTAMHRLVPGIEFIVKGSRGAPFLIYADDGIILTDSIHTLQLATEVMWVMTKILGLHMQVKAKKKTAWSGIYYDEEGKESDITGWEVVMPDGDKIPQLMGTETYKYLGTYLRTGRARGNSIKDTRKVVAGKAKRIIFAIGRLPGMSQEQMGITLALGIAGVLGYYARSTPMDMGTCKSIEEARAKVLRAAGYATGWPRGQIYHRATEGGMETHEHAYEVAAAAFCDQVDRALCGTPGRMDYLNVAEALAETCYRLECRGVTPLEWNPAHLLEELDETRMMEAYIKYKLVLGLEGAQTRGATHEALSRSRWREAPRTPRLWEKDVLITGERNMSTKPIIFHRALAEIGIAEWADIYDARTKEHYTMGELCKKY